MIMKTPFIHPVNAGSLSSHNVHHLVLWCHVDVKIVNLLLSKDFLPYGQGHQRFPINNKQSARQEQQPNTLTFLLLGRIYVETTLIYMCGV